MSFWVGTLVFLAIQALVTLGVNFLAKPGSRGLPHILGCTAVFQCWLMWAIVYIAQMNPLVLPELKE
jgi:V-type H+-transporting ATPase subunit e